MVLLVFCKSRTKYPFYTSLDLLGTPSGRERHDIHTQALRDAMEFVTRMVSVVHAAAALLRVLTVPRPQHLLTDAGAATGWAQTNGGIRSDGGVLAIWKAICAI